MSIPCSVKWCCCIALPESQACAVHLVSDLIAPREIEGGERIAYVESVNQEPGRHGWRGQTRMDSSWLALDCKWCEGTGDCPTCDGEGTHTCSECDDEHDCGSCNGEGKCDTCEGTGRDDHRTVDYLDIVPSEDTARPINPSNYLLAAHALETLAIKDAHEKAERYLRAVMLPVWLPFEAR